MKLLMITVLAAAIVSAAPASERDGERVVGAAVGAATGLIIANNVRGVDPWVAGPVGAVAGWYAADGLARWYDSDRRCRHDRVTCAGCASRYCDHTRRHTVACVPVQKQEQTRPVVQPPNLQPGVDLIRVTIQNSNGVRTEVPILRVGEKFVGPQGETYEALPTAAALAKQYGM